MSLLKKLTSLIADELERRTRRIVSDAAHLQQNSLENLLILQGRALALQNADRAPFEHLHQAEYKVFSQFGEDGILQYLIRESGIKPEEKSFVEFGVQNYLESNTRFLLMNDFWKGLIIDGDPSAMKFVRNLDIYWRYNLTAVDAWIDRDNINELIQSAGFYGNLGILSIDIDGNDYWVWERISVVDPVIVVVEWNSAFGFDHAVSIPYDPAYSRQKAHYSNLYWGASIRAFEQLGKRKGYALIGSNQAGNNLFFVKENRLGRLQKKSAEEAFVEACFRDSRDSKGTLNFLHGAARREEIADLPLVDLSNEESTTLRKLNASL